jgi:hypothetical protein
MRRITRLGDTKKSQTWRSVSSQTRRSAPTRTWRSVSSMQQSIPDNFYTLEDLKMLDKDRKFSDKIVRSGLVVEIKHINNIKKIEIEGRPTRRYPIRGKITSFTDNGKDSVFSMQEYNKKTKTYNNDSDTYLTNSHLFRIIKIEKYKYPSSYK